MLVQALWRQLFPNHCWKLINQYIKHPNQQATQIINLVIVRVYSSFRVYERKPNSTSILPSVYFPTTWTTMLLLWLSDPVGWAHFSLPQSVHRTSSLWVRNPRPTRDTEHCIHVKHSLCHCRSSNEMYLAPAKPGHTHTHGGFTVEYNAD